MDVIRHELTVACDQRAAFDLFTTGMGTWWDPRYSPDPATYDGIELDPRVGGTVAAASRRAHLRARARYGDWPHLLGRFAEAAARLTEPDPS